MGIRDDAGNAVNPASTQRPQEGQLAHIGLGVDGAQSEQSPISVCFRTDGRYERTGQHVPPPIATLDAGGIQPDVGI